MIEKEKLKFEIKLQGIFMRKNVLEIMKPVKDEALLCELSFVTDP